MGLFLSFCGFCMDKEEPALLLMVLRSGVLDQRQCRNCLLAVKGHPKRKSAGVHQLIVSPIERHSKKPDEARRKIVELMGDIPRVELFAREKSPDGTCGETKLKAL